MADAARSVGARAACQLDGYGLDGPDGAGGRAGPGGPPPSVSLARVDARAVTQIDAGSRSARLLHRVFSDADAWIWMAASPPRRATAGASPSSPKV
jgi:hypothetical protein